MQIRRYKESDLQALRAIHAAQGFGYQFPELKNPLFVTKLVLDTEGNQEAEGRESVAGEGVDHAEKRQGIVGAVLLRLTAEAYLLLNPKAGTPRERWQWLLELHEATRQEAWTRGFEDVHAWLPPEIGAKFGRRLTRLGWVRDDTWTPYCKRLG